MNSQLLTNILLSIIVVLLLIGLGQNRMSSSQSAYAPPAYTAPNPHAPGSHGSSPADMGDNFNPAEMVYAALKCPTDATLTLNEPSCAGNEANARKTLVDQLFDQGLSISKIFDGIIDAHGEDALTQEAIEIRRARRSQ